MASLLQAERASSWDYQVEELKIPGARLSPLYRVTAKDPLSPTQYEATHRIKNHAVAMVMGKVLDHNRNLVLERAAGRCENCGQRGPLQVHHKVFRSHGRDDRVGNLVAYCLDCHEAAHRRRSA